ncbi:MAG: segregation/condensation protein A [Candidatus Desantisbacteria bacterium]|mgnify:CR=1 FL=1
MYVHQPTFVGPVSELLDLSKKNGVDILKIRLSEITSDYLANKRNINEIGQFLVIVSALCFLKSQRLLFEETEASEEEADFFQDIEDYKLHKDASLWFSDKLEFSDNIFFNLPAVDDEQEKEVEVSLSNLILHITEIFLSKEEKGEIIIDEIRVSEKIEEIIKRLAEIKRISFINLIGNLRDRIELVVTFLALLEMVRRELIRAVQYKPFAPIWIIRR